VLPDGNENLFEPSGRSIEVIFLIPLTVEPIIKDAVPKIIVLSLKLFFPLIPSAFKPYTANEGTY